MKKLIVLFISLFVIVGCSCSKQMTAKDAVKDYLEQNEEVLKKQYKNLKYKITNETYDGDEALVSVTITVFDLYKAQTDANNYLNQHQDEFLDEDGVYDKSKFLDYKLEQMKNYKDTTDYTIEFHVVKNDDSKWEVQELSTDDLEKIHGIFQYES